MEQALVPGVQAKSVCLFYVQSWCFADTRHSMKYLLSGKYFISPGLSILTYKPRVGWDQQFMKLFRVTGLFDNLTEDGKPLIRKKMHTHITLYTILENSQHCVCGCVCVFHAACEILVPQPGNEPGPLAVTACCSNHGTTREFPHKLLETHPRTSGLDECLQDQIGYSLMVVPSTKFYLVWLKEHCKKKKKGTLQGKFPGRPVVRTRRFHCLGQSSINPWSGN